MKLATAPNLEKLRELIAEYYYTRPESIKLQDNGQICNNSKILSTFYYKKGQRYYFANNF